MQNIKERFVEVFALQVGLNIIWKGGDWAVFEDKSTYRVAFVDVGDSIDVVGDDSALNRRDFEHAMVEAFTSIEDLHLMSKPISFDTLRCKIIANGSSLVRWGKNVKFEKGE